jgi:hypothetical protein
MPLAAFGSSTGKPAGISTPIGLNSPRAIPKLFKKRTEATGRVAILTNT